MSTFKLLSVSKLGTHMHLSRMNKFLLPKVPQTPFDKGSTPKTIIFKKPTNNSYLFRSKLFCSLALNN